MIKRCGYKGELFVQIDILTFFYIYYIIDIDDHECEVVEWKKG